MKPQNQLPPFRTTRQEKKGMGRRETGDLLDPKLARGGKSQESGRLHFYRVPPPVCTLSDRHGEAVPTVAHWCSEYWLPAWNKVVLRRGAAAKRWQPRVIKLSQRNRRAEARCGRKWLVSDPRWSSCQVAAKQGCSLPCGEVTRGRNHRCGSRGGRSSPERAHDLLWCLGVIGKLEICMSTESNAALTTAVWRWIASATMASSEPHPVP